MDSIRLIEERLKGLFPDVLEMRLREASAELVRAELWVRPELCTVGGIMHGGAIMTLADTLGAIGTVLNLPEGARTATIESKTNFLRAAPVGSRVIGECTPVQRGKTLMVWQTRVLAEDGTLLALVTQTQLVMR